MPSIPSTSLSILGSGELSSNPATEVVFMVVGVISAAALIHYASPMHLTRVLFTAMTDAEKKYLKAIETGLLSASGDHTAEMLSVLQLKVSKIREESLSNSRSSLKAFCGFFKGRTLSVIRCIWEVRDLGTHIKASKIRKWKAPSDIFAWSLSCQPSKTISREIEHKTRSGPGGSGHQR
ncbi:hypothetical protein B0H19DRAFT_1061227 [Mycena capillaripes]|nr:hypothetical protein B0H19DRAFT_1061227 [Mycena capillaripes]